MRVYLIFSLLSLASNLNAQSIEILSVSEKDSVVEMVVSTDIEPPFEVMAGIALAGQKGDEIFIGNNERKTFSESTVTLSVSAGRNGEPLPSGTYEAEINFYPRWGAQGSPLSTQSISNEIHARKSFTLVGSNEAAASVADRDELQMWVMMNTAVGDRFNLEVFQDKLGNSEEFSVTNRNEFIRGHYFPLADMTLFENRLRGTLVTWREGRVNRL